MKMTNETKKESFNRNLNYNTPNSSIWKFGISIILLGFILIAGLYSTATASNVQTLDPSLAIENRYQLFRHDAEHLEIDSLNQKKRFTID